MTSQPTPPLAPVDVAEQAAEAIRALNHATRHPDVWTWPCDLAATLGELRALAERLPQTFAQVASWLDAASNARTLGHDQGEENTGVAVLISWAALNSAVHHASQLAENLATVHEETSHLTATAPAGVRA